MTLNGYSNWLEIDLRAIRNNIHELKKITGKAVMVVLKANGYGHGLVEVAHAAEQAGAGWCGVARIEEALILRQAGIRNRILVLGYTSPLAVPRAVAENISLIVYDREVAAAYAAEGLVNKTPVAVHVKFDTGMGRLGYFPQDGVEFVRWIKEQPGLKLEGVYTHLARADERDVSTTDEQIARFSTLLAGLDAEGLRPQWVHAANSAATLYRPETRYDLVRCGIAVYGLDPAPEAPAPKGFIPALSWKTLLISVKMLPPKHGVSYGHSYFTRKVERIGVLATGYADGFRRTEGNFVLVRGKRVPVVGNVCMDQCMVQLDDVPDAQIGDEVVLIGRQGDACIRAEEVAKTWGTINYEVICGLANRVPRLYKE
jgi:alanine racemase